MKILEMLNHTESLVWVTIGKFEIASFILNDSKFQIQIETTSISEIPEFKQVKIGEVSFARNDLDTVEAGFKTQPTGKNPVKIYGAVANGLADKFKEYDVFFFKVIRRHSNTDKEYQIKQDIYTTMTRKIRSSVQCWYYEFDDKSEKTFIVSKIKISDETSKATGFINPLKEAMLAVNFECAWINDL